MKISKKTLDEAIDTYRKYWHSQQQPANIMNFLYKKARMLCQRISTQVSDKINYVIFDGILRAYTKCAATNETIYKAIELLGIEVK